MKLMALLPFMDEEEIKELATKIINGEVKGISLVVLFPFLSREDFDEIVQQLIEQKDFKQLYGALPFLSKTTLNNLYTLVKDGKLEGFKEEALLPFLGKDQLKGLFDELVKDAMNQTTETVDETVADLFEDDEEDTEDDKD